MIFVFNLEKKNVSDLKCVLYVKQQPLCVIGSSANIRSGLHASDTVEKYSAFEAIPRAQHGLPQN